jgi:hypothetical protein
VPDITGRLRKRLDLFTPHRDGFVRKHAGQTLFVLGKGKFLAACNESGPMAAIDLLETAWETRREAADQAGEDSFARLRASGGLQLVHLLSEFYEYLDERVRTGKPKRMEETTAWDYKRSLNELGTAVGPDRPINDLGPADFGRYAKAISHNAQSSYGRKVAYVESFMRWALQLGRLGNNRFVRELTPGMDPLRSLVGPVLLKPSKADLRDERIVKSKSFTPAELGKLWHVADDRERLWIGLGLNGALDNADVMAMVWRVVAVASQYKGVVASDCSLVLDYRRRKRGRVRRVVPLVPAVACRLADHLVVSCDGRDPTDDELVFRSDDGKSLRKFTASGPQNYITSKFRSLMVRAGIRPPAEITIDEQGRKHAKSAGNGDGRGFRSLRTTFANLAPSGFRDEIEIVMGHSHGQTILDSYLETQGFSRLYELVTAVWEQAFSEPPDESWQAAHPPRAWPASVDKQHRSEAPPAPLAG